MAPNRLVLFDIDGTILWGGHLWKESFLEALDHHFPNHEFPSIPFCGKTDVQITRELMAAAGFTPNEIEEKFSLIVDLYIEKACAAAKTRSDEVVVLPGVKEVLQRLSEHDAVCLGLLTGNVRKGAYAKLGCVGLDRYFSFGVFGDDHWDRYELPSIALSRAKAELALDFTGKQLVIIGDTVHDINCGKSVGARSIAVGTGRNIPVDDLLAQNPDYYFKDLSNTTDVIEAILEDL